MTKEKIIVTSGDFDPISIKELQFLQKCRAKGDWLVIGLHSDIAVHMKTAKLNQDYEERKEILSNIKGVDEVFRFNDADGTVCNLLKLIKLCYPLAEITYVSEHDMHNMPETKIRGITFEVLKA
jgi:glycerol-3-phosphate cytidylyltransferase-like family protein